VAVYALCLLWAAVFLAVHRFGRSLGLYTLTRQELATLDFRFQQRGARPPAPEIVIVAIDEHSINAFAPETIAAEPRLALLKQWPFPRTSEAEAIERIYAAGARGAFALGPAVSLTQGR